MKRRLFLFYLLMAAGVAVHAQGYEWVRSYTGRDKSNDLPYNTLKGSCVDSAGNLYILGEFSPQAELCGERLLPSDIATGFHKAVLIAKLSPSGELLWHKAIYSPQVSSYAYALRMVGDSSIMAMTQVSLPFRNTNNYYRDLYFLDTLLTGNDNFLMPDSIVPKQGTSYTAFITFDFDGNATERHIIGVGYTDTIGNALTHRFLYGSSRPDVLYAYSFSDQSFNVDKEGSIYVIRISNDEVMGSYCDTCEDYYYRWSIKTGTIGAMQIVVDGTRRIIYDIPCRTAANNLQLLKFSPHFDSLLGATYMFDSALDAAQNTRVGYCELCGFSVDAQNNLYITTHGYNMASHFGIANSNSLHLGDSMNARMWIIRYNSDLYATDLIRLSHDRASPETSSYYLSYVTVDNCYVDDSSNSLFVAGVAHWPPDVEITNIRYNNDTLDLVSYSSFWMRLNLDDLSLISLKRILPGGPLYKNPAPQISISKNRVFAEKAFNNAVDMGDTVIRTIPPYGTEIVFSVWDFDGNGLFYKQHGLSVFGNGFYAPVVKDSIVYITGRLYESATFDTISIRNYGNSQVVIAKYVDPEFARPYIRPSDRQEQTIAWPQDLRHSLADSPVLLEAVASSGLPVSYTSSDSTVAYVRGDTLHLVAEGYAWLTATQDGDYYYLPAEPVQRLLTVGGEGIASVGADGQAMAYPNPTSGRVTIDLGEIPPAPLLPYHRPRQSDSSDVDMVLYTSPGAPFMQYETNNYPYHQRYNMKVSGPKLQSHDGVVTAWLTDMQGRREEVVLSPTGPDQYTLDLTKRPPAAYLLTVTTADGRELTFRLVRQYDHR